MLRAISAALLLTAVPAISAAQNKPRSIQLQGAVAKRLISLLVSGSDTIASAIRDGSTRIVLHDLFVIAAATYKYDGDGGMYRLDVYSANAKIGDDVQFTRIYEATALYTFFSSLRLRPGLSMQGSDLGADKVDCRIETKVPFGKPHRFTCDVTVSYDSL